MLIHWNNLGVHNIATCTSSCVYWHWSFHTSVCRSICWICELTFVFQSLEQNFLIVYHDFGGYDLCWKYCATENPDATDTSFVFYFLAHVICNDLIWLEISPVYVPHPLCFCDWFSTNCNATKIQMHKTFSRAHFDLNFFVYDGVIVRVYLATLCLMPSCFRTYEIILLHLDGSSHFIYLLR